MLERLWPRSLRGQVLLAIALALFLAQGIGAALLYRAEHERVEGALIHTAAFRLAMTSQGIAVPPPPQVWHPVGGHGGSTDTMPPPFLRDWRAARTAQSPQLPGEPRERHEEEDLRQILADRDLAVTDVVVIHRPIDRDPISSRKAVERQVRHPRDPKPERVLLAAIRLRGSNDWLVARVFMPPSERLILQTLVGQTLFIYLVLVGAMWLLLRRITQPLAALTTRLDHFAQRRDLDGQLAPEGPDDVARLITAHNAMEARLVALLDEKDVMLGAIGHDLKTPLAALRVRIESVTDDSERARMAATIEDITRTLDDILSLARVGRPSDPQETTELSALVASVVEEYEDMGEPVELADTQRIVVRLRPTWIRRALRNLVGNALRYGGGATVTLHRDGAGAVIHIRDRGPGIPDEQIGSMLEPFNRGEPSRNSETGGAGLGLTLARAIAEQHGGKLTLMNERDEAGRITGLLAILRLPLA